MSDSHSDIDSLKLRTLLNLLCCSHGLHFPIWKTQYESFRVLVLSLPSPKIDRTTDEIPQPKNMDMGAHPGDQLVTVTLVEAFGISQGEEMAQTMYARMNK
jgi:hypothetical protein